MGNKLITTKEEKGGDERGWGGGTQQSTKTVLSERTCKIEEFNSCVCM
jgi:hypothetical protein